MKIKSLSAVLILLVAGPAFAVDTNFLQGLEATRYHLVESEIIGRNFHVYVSLPDSYEESGDAYPTIYLLDGGNLFPMLAPYHRYLNFGEEVPEAIVVGISYGADDFENGNYRSTDFTAPSDERDYWGGAADYQSFLSEELMPLLETDYRSDPSQRIIFGQSIGGQFVLYSAMTKPKLFWGHIASNPALHRNLAFYLQEHADYRGPTQSKLFIASGTKDDPRFREPALGWIDFWRERQGAWQLKAVDLEGHSHMSAPPAAFRQGLRWLFSK